MPTTIPYPVGLLPVFFLFNLRGYKNTELMKTEFAVVGLIYITKFPTALTLEDDQENKAFPRQGCNMRIHIGSPRFWIMIASNADLHSTRQGCTLFQYIL